MRYFMLYDESLQQRREGRFIVLLAVGTIVALLLASLLGTRLADWVIAPLYGLARQMRDRSSEPGLPPLAGGYARDELGELARVFDRHLARIQAFVERERNFTSDLSHELRTALAVILSATEILLEDANLNERQKMRIGRIERAAREMAEMGVALMLMAREENPQQENAPCAVSAVIEEALEKHQHLLKNKPVQIQRQLDPDFYILADRNLLYITVSNLLRNALAYTEQGEIHVQLANGMLTITDSGKGIAPAQAEQVFLRYFRSSASEGAGIGLSLVKRIVDLHGWKIRLFPNPQGGTVAELIFSAEAGR
jgi:signal transduction histidine kinase